MLDRLLPPSLAQWSRRVYREATGNSRCLPDFVIIGAQKAGTTSLFFDLGQHPQVFLSTEKEVHYFDGGLDESVDNYERGERWYRSHFPTIADVRGKGFAGEASPLYMFNPLVPERMAKLIPKAKLIAILRHPTERAISHFFHLQRKGYETLPIAEAFRAEEGRMKEALERHDYRGASFRLHSYKSRGLYKEQLERFLRHYPKDQLLVIHSDDYFTMPAETHRAVFEFIGVDPSFLVPNVKPRNVSTNRTKVDATVYDYLNQFFAPHNQALYQMLGRDFGW